MKARTIEKNACVVHESGDHLTVLLDFRGAFGALGLELPLVRTQASGRQFHALAIGFVGEVSSVTAATLNQFGRGPRKYPLATIGKNARPVALDERGVDHPRTFVGGVFEADPFVGVEGR